MRNVFRSVAVASVVVALAVTPSVGAATSSPRGTLIFEGWGAPDQWGVAPAYDIWIVNEDGSGLTNLTDAPGYEGNATWSPDGTRIAFDSNQSGNDDIFVMNHDGTRQKRLTSSEASELWPTWSPDGRRIAYGKGTQLWVMGADGSHKRKIYRAPGENVMLSDWSPDGRWIAFTIGSHPRVSDWDIYVIRPDGSGLKKLISTAEDEGGLEWSSDGTKIAFHRFFGASCNPATACNWDVFTARADGKGEVNLTDTPLNAEYGPTWSPDGSRIAYADEYGTMAWEADIFVMDADGTNRRRLVSKPDTFDYSVDWNPRM